MIFLFMGLTVKQERFCQEFVLYGNQSRAYRIAYNAENMSDEAVHVEASRLSDDPKVSLRISELQDEQKKKFQTTLEDTVRGITEIASFDIAELYDENGKLKNIHDIPKHIRSAISGIKVFEEYDYNYEEKKKELTGFTKEVKILSKLDAFEKLMKHFNGYKQHQEGGSATINLTGLSDQTVKELANVKPANGA